MKKALLTAGALAVMAAATPASAAIYKYETNIGNGIGLTEITIDTDAQTAKFQGRNIDLLMKDSDLANWKPDLTRWGTTNWVDSLSGTFTRYGRHYTAYWSSNPKRTQFRLGDNYSFLWLYGRDRWGRTFDFDGKGTWTRYTSSTGGSSSGTQVSEPGALGLLGLALAALAFGQRGRRRRKTMRFAHT